MGDIKVNSFKDFSNFLKGRGKNAKTLLLGNGFCLDHPKLGEAFKFNSKDPHIRNKLLNILDNDHKCPEMYLKDIRNSMNEAIIEYYLNALDEKLKDRPPLPDKATNTWLKYTMLHKECNCQEFIKRFDQIFTVNYDPLTYWELLKIKKDGSNKLDLVDGFKGEQWIFQSEIIDRLENKEGHKLYYLHGASFIMINNLRNKLHKLDPKNLASQPSLKENGTRAFILESRWEFKKTLFERYEYLTHCRKALINSKGDMVIFGMSFENDAHIVDMLMEYAENNEKNERQIFVTYLDLDEEKHPKKIISEIIDNELKPYYYNNDYLKSKFKNRKDLLLERLLQYIKIEKNSKGTEVVGIVWDNVSNY